MFSDPTTTASKDKKPIMVSSSKCKLPLVTGSVDSREFHRALYYNEDVQINKSKTIEHFVLYKASAAFNWFLLYALHYIVYLGLLVWYGHESIGVIAIFFVFQLFLLVVDIYERGAIVIRMAMILLDMFRLIPMAVLCFYYYGLGLKAEIATLGQILSFVNFISWIGLVKYLRRMPGVRGYLPLLEASMGSLVNFLVIIILFMVAFGTSIRLKTLIMIQADADDKFGIEESFGGTSVVGSIVNQYRFMFADFSAWDSHEEHATPIDYLFAFGLTFMISIVLFNLIVAIFTDTYGDLKEDKAAEDIRMLNEVVMDVEYFILILFRFTPCFLTTSYSA
jgi:hypothetical protein